MKDFINNRLNYFFENNIIIENIFAFLVPVFILLGTNSFTSLLFTISFSISFIIIFFYFSKVDFDIILFLIIFFSFINIYLDMKFSHLSNINFSYYDKLLFFINTLIVFKITSIIKLRKNYVNLMIYLLYFLGILFLISYYVLHNVSTNSGGIGKILTMGFQNPNFTAMWLTQCIMFQIIFFIIQKNYILKIISLIITSLLIIILLKTLCRSCLVELTFFVFFIVKGLISKNYKFSNLTIIIITLTPLLFCFIYMFLLNSEWFYNIFSFLISEGKDLSSRDGMTYIFEVLSPYNLIGNYSIITGGTGQGGVLNICLDIWFSYGLIVLFLFIFFLYKIISTVNNQIINKFQYFYLCAFLANIIQGCFEPALVSGCTGLNCIISIFISLAINYNEVNNE